MDEIMDKEIHDKMNRERTQLHMKILEEIQKNSKEMENFLNININIRNKIYELIQLFLTRNDEST